MQLQLDTNKVYAFALQGGGAKGSYEVGVWRAFDEAGIRYNAVAGTSVGALNGAMMAMRKLDEAEALWRNMRFSMVMDVDDATMQKVMAKDWKGIDMPDFLKWAAGIARERGFDVEPLRKLLREAVSEEAVRASDVDFYLVTVSLSDRKELDVRARDLPEGRLHDMLLASAYLPAFKNVKLHGKRYMDGGLTDALPYDVLINHGYRDLIVVRLPGSIGREKRTRVPADVTMIDIAPERDLGNVLNFSAEQCEFDMQLGYYDAKRALYGLRGHRYYLERTWSEEQAYALLCGLIRRYDAATAQSCTLRALHTQRVQEIMNETGYGEDYYEILLHFLECAAKFLGISEFQIMTDAALYEKVCASPDAITDPASPSCLRYFACNLRAAALEADKT